MLIVVVVLLLSVLVQGLTKVSDQSRALEDRNDSINSLEVHTPNSFIHLFYNSPYMDVVDMHNILTIQSDSVLWEKTMEASSCRILPCQLNFKSVFDIPVWEESGNRQPLDISALPGRLLTANIHCPHTK